MENDHSKPFVNLEVGGWEGLPLEGRFNCQFKLKDALHLKTK